MDLVHNGRGGGFRAESTFHVFTHALPRGAWVFRWTFLWFLPPLPPLLSHL